MNPGNRRVIITTPDPLHVTQMSMAAEESGANYQTAVMANLDKIV